MKRPTLTIGVRAGVPPMYALAGWEELDRYARLNHPLWAAVRERCETSGFSEGDSLKLLCAALLEESENQRAMIERYVEEVGTLPPLNVVTLKADMFDYLCWLEDFCCFRQAALDGKAGDYLVTASDGITCWGKTYADAVRVAMEHDKEMRDATSSPNIRNLPRDE